MSAFAIRILIGLLAATALGVVAWLLLGSDPEESLGNLASQVRSDDSRSPADSGPTEASENAAPVSSSAYGDRARPLLDWFGQLAVVLEAGDGEEIEAVRYGIRQEMARARPDLRPVLEQVEPEVAGREIIPLFLDVFGPPAVEDLIVWLADLPLGIRSAAYFRLARLGPTGRQVLARVLPRDDDERAGSEALAWLLHKDGQAGFEAALAAAPSRDTVIRSAIAAALGRPGDSRIASVLRGLLAEDLPYKTREAIADALAAGYPQALRERPTSSDNLLTRSQNADPVTRSLALREAGNFMDAWKTTEPGAEEILRVRNLVLQVATSDPDPLVRRAAILSRVGLKPGITNLRTQCEVLLEVAGKDPNPGVRAAVLKRIHRGCSHTAMPFGPSYLEPYITGERNSDVRREALRTLPRYAGSEFEGESRQHLVAALRNDPDVGVRLEAAALLTELGYDEAREQLLDAARHDPDPRFRRALFEAARDQLAEGDPDLVRELARLNPELKADLASLPVEGDPSERVGLRLEPGYRQLWEKPVMEDSIGANDFSDSPIEGETGEAMETATTGEAAVQAAGAPRESLDLDFRPTDTNITIRGRLEWSPQKEGPLLLVIQSGPLLGGSSPLLTRSDFRSLALRHGCALLTFSYRGRGSSEGWSGQGVGERADLAAVSSWVREVRSKGGLPADCRLDDRTLILAEGRGAEFLPENIPQDSPLVLILSPILGSATSGYAAQERAKPVHSSRRTEARRRVEAWLLEHAAR